MIIAGLILLGLCLGSFVNALVWRLHKQEKGSSKYSILKGRSVCTHCGHKLAMIDLIPVVSWITLGGKCRYCKKPISPQYPAVELLTAGLFVASYIFWPGFGNNQYQIAEIINLAVWLASSTGLVALTIYDLRWMLLPNKIVFPLLWLNLGNVAVQALFAVNYEPLISAFWGVIFGGGIFYLLFQLSGGKWIGGGDVKLGFLLGMIVGGPVLAFLLLFIACFLGSVVSVPLLVSGKANRQSRIPFGPFLITSAIIVRLFGKQMADWYTTIFLV